MRIFILTLLTAFVAVCSSPTFAQENTRITVLEQFTSMLCGDSHDSDILFSKIASENPSNVIMLACHVPGFDRLEQASPLSLEACHERFVVYSTAMIGNGGIPDMIMNGRFQMNGNRENVIRAGISMSQAISEIQEIALHHKGGELHIELPTLNEPGPRDLWLLSTQNTYRVTPETDPIAEIDFTYRNIMRHSEKLFEWDGRQKSLSLNVSEIPGDRFVVLAQKYYRIDGVPDIVAAGQAFKN